ncbi:MAG: HAD family phosphatase, partial [Nanoarchaeota archaeon]|nr:HAD family phosphatase [Nanoarchaeota archaeon]
HIKSAEEIIGIKKELQEKFPKLIKAYESVMVAEEFKIDYIPRGITTTALIFDLDGTLVNTEKFDGKILKKILDSYGLSSHKRFKGYSLEDYISKTTSDKQLQKKIKKEFISKYELILKNIQIEINSELLRYLKLGLSPLIALVTANNKQLTRRILNKTGLSKYFEIIVTCEDVKRQKPFPDPYLKALKELNVSPENCIVFEDSEVGVNSAKNAGIKNIRKVSY